MAASVLGQPSETGTTIYDAYAMPATLGPAKTFVITIKDERASYVKVHFEKYALANDDRVVVRSPDRVYSWVYDAKREGEWWSPEVPGTTAIIELQTGAAATRAGIAIDRYIRGYSLDATMRAPANNPGGVLRVCGSDDRHNTICFEPNTAMYGSARAVARLMMGSRACTGWLWGSAGHVLTNHHCIANQLEAASATITFEAQAPTCDGKCLTWGACPGTTLTAQMELVKTSAQLDYTLLRLTENPVGVYGYLRARETGPLVRETIYIPQHPFGYDKRIAAHSSHKADDGAPRLTESAALSCTAAKADVGYYADTSNGSSGSPVISDTDHLVIALHHCLGCTPNDQNRPNSAVPIDAIIQDIGKDLLPPDAVVPAQK